MKKLISMLLLAVSAPFGTAWAASVAIVPGTNGGYCLQAFDLNNVGGAEIELMYDSGSLANPVIVDGALQGGLGDASNPNFTDNSVKIVLWGLNGISGSGTLKEIKFNTKTQEVPVVGIKRIVLTDPKGKKLSPVLISTGVACTAVGNGPASGSQSGAPQSGSQQASAQQSSSQQIVNQTDSQLSGNQQYSSQQIISQQGSSAVGDPALGTITLPNDLMATTERKTEYQPLVTDLRKDMTVPVSTGETAPAATTEKVAAKEKAPEKKSEAYKGVLSLFKAYKGERVMKSLISLFADPEIPGFVQTPAIAFADGSSSVKVELTFKPAGGDQPKLLALGASVKSFQSGSGETTWVLELVPKKDVFEAGFTVIDGENMYDYPLTVVPKIDPALTAGKKLSEADFATYLTKQSTYDFNGDKKFDAVDDFIYTANYIVAMKIKPEKTPKTESAPKKDAVDKGAKPESPAKKPVFNNASSSRK